METPHFEGHKGGPLVEGLVEVRVKARVGVENEIVVHLLLQVGGKQTNKYEVLLVEQNQFWIGLMSLGIIWYLLVPFDTI